MSGVWRRNRVSSSRPANSTLARIAISAGQLIVWVDGCSAISTPTKPPTIAIPRARSMVSPRNNAAPTETNSDEAR
jgi:hypothetical protein